MEQAKELTKATLKIVLSYILPHTWVEGIICFFDFIGISVWISIETSYIHNINGILEIAIKVLTIATLTFTLIYKIYSFNKERKK